MLLVCLLLFSFFCHHHVSLKFLQKIGVSSNLSCWRTFVTHNKEGSNFQEGSFVAQRPLFKFSRGAKDDTKIDAE